MNLLAQNGNLTTNINIIMLVVGLLCLVFAFIVILFYRKKITREKEDREKFKVKEIQTKYKIFYFWGHVAYVLVIFALFVSSIIFLSIFIGSI